MAFEIKKIIPGLNSFYINRSSLENRLDPIYYGSDLTKFNSGKFDSVSISSIVSSMKSGIGAGKQDQTDESGVIQIRPTNMDENGLLKFERNVYLPENDKIETLKIDDIIFNNTNSQELVGKTAILKDNLKLYFSNHITRIRVKKEIVVPEYLWIILNLYQKHKIFYSICTNWNNQSGVGLELLKNLRIPLPSLSIQKEIIAKYNKAYQEKLQKEQKAKNLLNNIDNYLLDELGIKLPIKDTNLVSRINKEVSLRDITGGRFDPMLYDKNTIALRKSIIDVNPTRFKKVQLKNLVIQSLAGDWGLDEEDLQVNEDYQKCLVIRATEFDNNFNLNIENSRVKYRMIKKEKLKRIDIKANDLLIEKSGGSPDQPVGRIAIIDKEIFEVNKLCYSNFIHKIRVDNEIINPSYLFNFLKTIHNIKLTESMQSQTNGIRNLIMSNYLNQYIILPLNEKKEFDMSKQELISNKINGMRNEAKRLQREAIEVLENAKIEVEKIILG